MIADDITPLEQLHAVAGKDVVLFEPRPAIEWKNDPQSQRHATNRDFKGTNPQGGTAIDIWANSEMGAGKVEFLQGTNVVSAMDVQIKSGMNRFQWNMREPAPAGAGGGGGPRGGRGRGQGQDQPAGAQGAAAPAAGAEAGNAEQGGGGRGGRGGFGTVPFVATGRGGGGGGGFGGIGGAMGNLVAPGTYMVKLTVGSQTFTTSVTVLEDIWMRPQ
jgi:hypothetical protein